MSLLFPVIHDSNTNYLPQDGMVNYHGKVFSQSDSDRFYNRLLTEIDWRHDEIMMFGKKIVTKRKVAWYGEQPFQYTYSNVTKRALYWTPELLELKNKIEEETKETYNSCLMNLYHCGDEGMGWHSDNEKDLQKHGAIASISFGAERKFAFKHRTSKEVVELLLEHGSLLVMKNETQDYWLHRLPPTKKINAPRINLTFRTIVS